MGSMGKPFQEKPEETKKRNAPAGFEVSVTDIVALSPHSVSRPVKRVFSPLLCGGLALFLLFSPAAISGILAAPVQWTDRHTAHFHLRFASRDRKAALHLLKEMEPVRERVKRETGLVSSGTVTVVLAPDVAAFRKLLAGKVPYWADGAALPVRRLIVLKSPRILPGLNLREVFAHEYTHIVLGRHFGGEPIPTWLNEGLAMYLSREWDWSRATYMTRAVLTRRVIPLERLEGRFPSEGEQARLAYAESYYFVSFLTNVAGPHTLRRFLKYYARGFGFPESLYRSSGLRYPELRKKWKRFLQIRFSVIPLLTSGATLWFLMVLLCGIGYVRARKRAQRKKKRWEQEEANGSSLLPPGGGDSVHGGEQEERTGGKPPYS